MGFALLQWRHDGVDIELLGGLLDCWTVRRRSRSHQQSIFFLVPIGAPGPASPQKLQVDGPSSRLSRFSLGVTPTSHSCTAANDAGSWRSLSCKKPQTRRNACPPSFRGGGRCIGDGYPFDRSKGSMIGCMAGDFQQCSASNLLSIFAGPPHAT